MKQSEVLRIPGLIAARQPTPTVEETSIGGTRMLVIVGDEVDTVIRYNRGGGADMPQLSSYPEVAESAAHADERLAKQRASGRKNTTGEGVEWPRNWKLVAAKAGGRIWYESKPQPGGISPTVARALTSPARQSSPAYESTTKKVIPFRDSVTLRKPWRNWIGLSTNWSS